MKSVTPEIEVGTFKLSLVSRSREFGTSRGRVVWSRPSAVLVTAGGEQTRLRIVDVTRWVQVILLLVALLAACLALVWNGGRKEISP